MVSTRRGRTCARLLLAACVACLACLACNALLGNEPVSLDVLDARPDPKLDAAAPSAPPPWADASAEASACAADLARDPRNCGACGRDCLAGACSGGLCQPFVVATALPGPAHLATDDAGTLYVVTADGAVRACSTSGCGASTRVVTALGADAGNPLLTGLTARGGNVYFAGYYTNAIYACPTSGCARPTIVASGVPQPFHLQVDATNLYFVSASAPFVGRCALPSCAGGVVRMATDGLKAYYGTVADGPYVYWYGGGPTQQFDRSIVYRTPKTAIDAAPEVLLRDRTVKFGGPSMTNLALRDGQLYFPEDGPDALTGTLLRFTLGSTQPPTVLVGKLPPVRGVAVDDRHVYFVSYQAGTISRCDLAGCAAPTTLATSQDTPTGPLITRDAVYWTEYSAGNIKGIAK